MLLVAPYVGAWIETMKLTNALKPIASHPTWVRGLKHQCALQYGRCGDVAPYVGAWIETLTASTISSHSSVAPYVGAWIETIPLAYLSV